MQGVYFKRGNRFSWTLIRRTRSVPDAENLVRRVSKVLGRGFFEYVEARYLPKQVKTFRAVRFRRLGAWKVTGTILVAK